MRFSTRIQECIRKPATRQSTPDNLVWSVSQKCTCLATCPLGDYEKYLSIKGNKLKGKNRKILGTNTKIFVKKCPAGQRPTKILAICKKGQWLNIKNSEPNPELCA